MFAKINLLEAQLQILLEEESRNIPTITAATKPNYFTNGIKIKVFYLSKAMEYSK